ncbi:MAG: Gfo/Idh/MocA family oxidoreductase [Methanoregula sp.]
MVGVGIVGYGYWGPNLVRNFSEVDCCEVVAVSDFRKERLSLVSKRYPKVKTTTEFQDILRNEAVDAVVIATPVSTHYDLTMQALRAGKHVFVEKPIAHSSKAAQEMIDEAKRLGLTLQVDHTFIYTGAVEKMHQLVAGNELGDIYYYDSVRVNLGLFQNDVSVVWDLAVHDLAIMDYIIPERPVSVSAIGISHVPGKPQNLAYITLLFNSTLIAHFHVNWLSPVKVRRALLGGSRKMVVYDDLEPSEKIKIYDRGITVQQDKDDLYKLMIGYRVGDMHAPQLDITEALLKEARHFVDCIQHHKKPLTSGESGLQIVKILEAASESMTKNGKFIPIS